MDFIDRLKDSINTLALPIKSRIGYLSDKETLVIYPIAGSSVSQKYMDSVKDVNLNYEIAMKSKDGQKINDTLWIVQNYLEQLEEITSSDNSFEFSELKITNKPYINYTDESGWFVFLLDITASITVFN